MKLFGTSDVLSLVSWNVTCRCNLRCSHCYLQAGEDHHEEFSWIEGLRVIEQIAELSPGAMLVLSGGEPLLRPDILSLAEYASLLGLAVVLGSNGTLLDASLAQELKRCGVQAVGISLDSPEPSYHDAFRGVPGAWDGAMRGIEACRQSGLEYQVHTTLTQGNYDHLEGMMKFALDLGAAAFHLFFLVCTGRGQEMSDVSPQQYEEALSMLAECQRDYQPLMVRARCAPHFQRVVRQRAAQPDGRGYLAGCLAGSHYCRITCQGEVTPCPYIALSAGILRRQPLAAIWQNAPLLRDLRTRRAGGKCGRCDFGEWCQGCRARAFAARGSLWEEDPWCVYQPPQEGASTHRPPTVVKPHWTPEARALMDKAPPFIRPMACSLVEQYARIEGTTLITVELVERVKGRSRGQRGSHMAGRKRPGR